MALKGMSQGVIVKIGPIVIKDAAEKIGGLFGEKGRIIGKKIDDKTKWLTIGK
ncbi:MULTISPECIES: hypothetical protein [Clostridium]|uniref:Uncharacterized protein n=1 Tax=Clostridium frigoriphilum TaxID=443253 RepID=A0ABU7UL59_9CLOT|nr:hypothetical protein [Clostridium sp. DSM 17811]MBU3097680.1 hypothetical protein [Clostridium sp. DSM 17811]